jgi:ketosteroid isomerase-like protein
VTTQFTPEEAVRAYFDCYSDGRPADFDQVVAPDYVDYGHNPPGHGPGGARDDYENAVKTVGGLIRYTIDALVVDDDVVAASWTGKMPDGKEMKGMSLYRTSRGLITSARHELIGTWPPA